VVVHFEGVNITTKVYVNAEEVGSHLGGYIGFAVDIANVVKQVKMIF
tara:strand:+ start:539 stop:679 length:141 start_codon:yes stop_codon:yes gene_type:complete